MQMSILLAEGRTSHDVNLLALLFFLSFGSVGCALALNFRGFADTFLRFTSLFMLGTTGSATPRTLRFVGIVMGALSAIGVEISKPF
jgi:hypothetical protein